MVPQGPSAPAHRAAERAPPVWQDGSPIYTYKGAELWFQEWPTGNKMRPLKRWFDLVKRPTDLHFVLMALGVVAVLGLATSSLLASPEPQTATATPTPPATPSAPGSPSSSGPQWISVSGDGEALGAPDLAQVVIGVTQIAPTSTDALSAANDALNGAIRAAKAHGVDDSDIQTSGLVLQPIFRNRPPNDTSPPEIQAYRANNNVTITIRDLNRAGDIIDAVSAGGANTVSGIRFMASNMSDLRAQSLADAVRNARKNAVAMAAAAGVHLGTVWTIVEESAPAPVPKAEVAFATGAGSTAVQPGELTVRGHVTVTFSITP